jgi:uncharacterized protein YjiS (DUF1127 family)
MLGRHLALHSPFAGVAAPRPRLGWRRLRLALAIRRERLALAKLDARALRDIGLSPDDAMAEAHRPLWEVPRGR